MQKRGQNRSFSLYNFSSKNRRGLSTVIVTLILILVSLVAVGIVWVVVRNVIQTGTEGVGLSQFSLNAKIMDVSINNNSNTVNLTVKRNAGQGDLTGINFIFSSDADTEVVTRNISLKELEEKRFNFSLTKFNVLNLISISIIPLIKQDGKEISGIALDKYNFGTGGGQTQTPPDCTSNCVGKVCGDDGCGGSCGTCGSQATCPSGTCVCNSGWSDCNNDHTCECDLSSNLCSGVSCVAQTLGELISADRRINWTNVGVSGGIPSRTNIRNCVIQDGVHANGVDTSSEIRACITNTPLNGVAYLPIGNYSLGSSIIISSNKTLRGEDVDKTALLMEDISWGVIIGGEYASPVAINIISGYTKGSNKLVLQDASTINIGSYIRVDELNDPLIPVTKVGYGTCTWCGRENGDRARGQFVKVIDKLGNTITISPEMYFTFSSANLPQVQKSGATTSSGIAAEFAGIENLTIRNNWKPSKVQGTDGKEYSAMRSHTSSSDNSQNPIIGTNNDYYWVKTGEDGSSLPLWQQNTFYDGNYNSQRIPLQVALTSNCWAKNIKIDRCGSRCIQLFYNNYKFELRDSHVVNCINRWDSDNCYGTLVGSYNSGILIENNIFESLADGPMFAWGASGNVVGYNYMYDTYRTSVYRTWFSSFGGSHHGAHTSYNLWEGNELEALYFDQYWGSHSHNTAFRNRILGMYAIESIADPAIANIYAIGTEQNVNFQNYLGNVLGKSGFHNMYEDKYPNCANGRRIYKTGYSSSGSCTGNTNSFNTMFRHMNYDYFTNSIKYCGDVGEPGCQGSDGITILPSSLYLLSKPSWFGSVAWPPIGPDVSGYNNTIPAKLRFQSPH